MDDAKNHLKVLQFRKQIRFEVFLFFRFWTVEQRSVFFGIVSNVIIP